MHEWKFSSTQKVKQVNQANDGDMLMLEAKGRNRLLLLLLLKKYILTSQRTYMTRQVKL